MTDPKHPREVVIEIIDATIDRHNDLIGNLVEFRDQLETDHRKQAQAEWWVAEQERLEPYAKSLRDNGIEAVVDQDSGFSMIRILLSDGRYMKLEDSYDEWVRIGFYLPSDEMAGRTIPILLLGDSYRTIDRWPVATLTMLVLDLTRFARFGWVGPTIIEGGE